MLRRSTAGSIAAMSVDHAERWPGGCSRWSNGGFHCGGACSDSPAAVSRYPAADTAGSIAACPRGYRATLDLAVPPRTGGLHCGHGWQIRSRQGNSGAPALRSAGSIAATYWTARQYLGAHGLPPFQRRAPLRHVNSLRPDRLGRASSRRPTAGSHCGQDRFDEKQVCRPIRWYGLHLRCGTGTPAAPDRHVRVPAVRRRAPLRPDFGVHRADLQDRRSRRSAVGSIAAAAAHPCSHGVVFVLPPFGGGLYCGSSSSTRPSNANCMLPAVDGGLHCGAEDQSSAQPFAGVRPAVRRRAPLRHHVVVLGHDPAGGLPPSDGGLHCGGVYAIVMRVAPGAPAVQWRAPLRPVCRDDQARGDVKYSRRRRAPLRHVEQLVAAHESAGAPASTAGSIAASTCERRRSLSRPVLPPSQDQGPGKVVHAV